MEKAGIAYPNLVENFSSDWLATLIKGINLSSSPPQSLTSAEEALQNDIQAQSATSKNTDTEEVIPVSSVMKTQIAEGASDFVLEKLEPDTHTIHEKLKTEVNRDVTSKVNPGFAKFFLNIRQNRLNYGVVIFSVLILLVSVFLLVSSLNKPVGLALDPTATSNPAITPLGLTPGLTAISNLGITPLTTLPTSVRGTSDHLFSFKDSLKDDRYLKEAIYCLTFGPGSKILVSVSGNSKINFWRVNANGTLDKTPLKSLTGYQTGVQDRASWVVYSKDGRRLAIASGSGSLTSVFQKKWEIAIWEVDNEGLPKTEYPLQTINPGAEHVPAFGLNHEGKIIASPGPNSSVILWDVDTNKQITTLAGHNGQAREISFSSSVPNGLLVASGDGTVKLWDFKSSTVLKTFAGHSGGAWSVTFNPDEKLVASGGSDKTINVADSATTTNLPVFTGKKQAGETYSVVFSPNGKVLATAGHDGNIIVWDVETGQIYDELKGITLINNLAFSPDGKYLASGTGISGNVIINLWQTADTSKAK